MVKNTERKEINIYEVAISINFISFKLYKTSPLRHHQAALVSQSQCPEISCYKVSFLNSAFHFTFSAPGPVCPGSWAELGHKCTCLHAPAASISVLNPQIKFSAYCTYWAHIVHSSVHPILSVSRHLNDEQIYLADGAARKKCAQVDVKSC